MKNLLPSFVNGLTSPIVTHVAAASAGVIVLATILMRNGRTIVISKEMYDKLIENDNFVGHFYDDKRHHCFHITFEQL